MNIIIKKHLLIYKGNKIKCCVGKSGITNSKIEGDMATQKGMFNLGSIYFRKDYSYKNFRYFAYKFYSFIIRYKKMTQTSKTVNYNFYVAYEGTY